MHSVKERYLFRKLAVRRKIFGTSVRPRLSVYASLKHIYAQIIDDTEGKTLAAASSREKETTSLTGVKAAAKVGALIGQRAMDQGVQQIVFDRGGKLYHGRLKALADSAREVGLKF